jgi:hypothetical protein
MNNHLTAVEQLWRKVGNLNMELALILFAIVLFELAAFRWGADSRDLSRPAALDHLDGFPALDD